MNAKDLTAYIVQILNGASNIVMSWGACDFAPIVPPDEKYSDGAGLQFLVNGFKFAGLVRIIYKEGADLFRVEFEAKGKPAKILEEVYCDMLVDTIDEYVELCENYEEKVKELTETDPLYKLVKNTQSIVFTK